MRYFDAKFVNSYATESQLPKSKKLEIVFVGRSNVGKSSMLNRLFNRKNLARVSSVPGKTATINFYDVCGVNFVDFPGYGYARVSKSEKKRWRSLIEGYFKGDRLIGLVVLLIDMRHEIGDLDLGMVEFLIDFELPFVVVLTKADKLTKSKRKDMLLKFRADLPCSDQIFIVEFSSKTGEGLERLKGFIEEVCEPE